MILTIPDWVEEAACRGTDPSLWFPTTHSSPHDIERARAICNGCPVREPCLEAALDHAEAGDVGIWAGTSPEERTQLRRDGAIWNG